MLSSVNLSCASFDTRFRVYLFPEGSAFLICRDIVGNGTRPHYPPALPARTHQTIPAHAEFLQAKLFPMFQLWFQVELCLQKIPFLNPSCCVDKLAEDHQSGCKVLRCL